MKVLGLLTLASLVACSDDPAPADTAEVSAEVTPDVAEVDEAEVAVEVTPEVNGDEVDGDDEPDEPGARGPYAVGYRSDEVRYDPGDGSGERTLRVVYWYPTEATTGADVNYLGILPAAVLGDAAPAELGPRPVVVFSHGNSAFAEQSFFFTELLASHGYVVAAMDHTGNTFADSADIRVFHWRPKDVSAVIDHLEAPAHPLAALVSEHIAVAGHSFGGYTTMAAGGARWDVDGILAYCVTEEIPLDGCAAIEADQVIYRAGFLDARVDALIPMAPGAVFVFGQGVADIALPTLLITAARDATTPNADDGDPAWAQLAIGADNRRIDFANGGHFTFSDACALPLGIGENDGCGGDFITSEAAHRVVNAYALAFLRRHLEGDERDAGLLDGDVSIEPDVTLSLGDAP